MNKRILAAISAVILIAGCGSSHTATPDSTPTATPTATLLVQAAPSPSPTASGTPTTEAPVAAPETTDAPLPVYTAPPPVQTPYVAPAPVEETHDAEADPVPPAEQPLPVYKPCGNQIVPKGQEPKMCLVEGPAPEPVAPPNPAPVSGYGCDAAIAYLQAHANPVFRIVCPGYAFGNQAVTCFNHPPQCTDPVIIINVPCAVAYQNEAANSWALWKDSNSPIDPYGSSC